MATKIKGQNLRVYLNGQVITAATSCQLRLRANMRDGSTKDTTGLFAALEVRDMAWEVSCDSAVWTGDGPGAQTSDLVEYRGATVAVELAVTDGDYNADKNEVMLCGNAVVTGITVTARNRENSTCTIIMAGRGKLAIPKWLADCDDYVLTTADGEGLTVAS